MPAHEQPLQVQLERDPVSFVSIPRASWNVVKGLALAPPATVWRIGRTRRTRGRAESRGGHGASRRARRRTDAASRRRWWRYRRRCWRSGCSEPVPLPRERSEGLRQHRPALREDELAPARSPDATTRGSRIAEVHLVEERERVVVELTPVADELDVARAVAEREELELPHVAFQNDATRDGDPFVLAAVGRAPRTARGRSRRGPVRPRRAQRPG